MQPDIQALDRQYIAGTYRRFPAVLRHGKGSLVYDENEKEYIDLSSGIAVNTFGYADDVWQAAVTAQLGTCSTHPTCITPSRAPCLLPCSAKRPA